MENEIFSNPLFYDNQVIWNFLSGESFLFDNVITFLMTIEEALIMYFIVIGTSLLLLRHIKWFWHFGALIPFVFLGDIVPSNFITSTLGFIFNSDRLRNLNTESVRYIILLIPTIGLLGLSFKGSTRTISRVLFAASGTIIFATTLIFHLVYFHTLQAVALESHVNHAKMVTLLSDTDFNPYCELSNLSCFSGDDREDIEDIEDKWIANYIIQRLQQIDSFKDYDNSELNIDIMKTNILGGGARTGFFSKGYNNNWRIVINQSAVKSFSKSLELSFWIQMVFAHVIWLLMSNLVIVFHDRKVFKHYHLKR